MIPCTRTSLGQGQTAAGEHVHPLECRVAERLGREFPIGCSSHGAALQLAMRALGLGPGDEVVVAAYGSPSAAHAVELCGATPIFSDVSADTYAIAPDAAAATITDRARAIVPTHLSGLPADMNALKQLAYERGLTLVEDAAGALGASFKGQAVGSFGRVVCIDFALGAMALTDDPELSALMRSLRGDGREIVDGRYQIVRPGLDCAMSDRDAAVALERWDRLDARVAARIELAKRYDARLRTLAWLAPPRRPEGLRHAYQAYVAQVTDHVDRNALIADLQAAGIEANAGALALPLTPYYRDKYALEPDAFPVATRLADRALALPLDADMRGDAVDAVCDALERCGPGNEEAEP